MVLEIYEYGKPRSIPIHEGEIFLLPANIPHSPQRKAGTVGLVLERERLPNEIDGLRWYTNDSTAVLYEETFFCYDLGSQLRPAIERFFNSDCYKNNIPAIPDVGSPYRVGEVKVDHERNVGNPIPLLSWVKENSTQKNTVLYGNGGPIGQDQHEYTILVKTVPDKTWEEEWQSPPINGEMLIYQISGNVTIDLLPTSTATSMSSSSSSITTSEIITYTLTSQHMLLLPANGYKVKAKWEPGCLCLVVINNVTRK